MKLRIVPIVTSVAVSAILLFGGWYTYQQWGVESPFQETVEKYEGVKQVDLEIKPEQVNVKLKLENGTDLAQIVRDMKKDGKKWIGDRELQVVVEDQATEKLNDVWEEVLFSVAQAMENKQYTEITTALDALQEEHANVTANTDMDDTNVYITLSDGQVSKFIILPRVPQQLGVL